MKRILFIVLIAIIGILVAEEAFPMLNLDEVSRDYLSDFKLTKTINLEGIGHTCAIAKDSGDMVVMTETEQNYLLHYIDIDGNILWEKEYEFPEDGNYGYRMYISDNGATISVIRAYGESVKTFILDRNGNELFSKVGRHHYYLPSKDGQYITKVPVRCNDKNQKGKLFTRTGQELEYDLPDDIVAKYIITSFIEKDIFIALIAYRNSEDLVKRLVGYNIIGSDITLSWQRDIKVHVTDMSYTYHIKSNKDYFVIRSNDKRANVIYIIDHSGDILFEYKEGSGSFGITQNNDIILNHSSPTDLRMIDFDTFSEIKLGVTIQRKKQANFIEDTYEIGENLFLSMYRTAYELKTQQHLNYQSLIYNAEKKKLFSAAPYLVYIEKENSKDVIVGIDQFSGITINIFRGVKK